MQATSGPEGTNAVSLLLNLLYGILEKPSKLPPHMMNSESLEHPRHIVFTVAEFVKTFPVEIVSVRTLLYVSADEQPQMASQDLRRA